MRLVSKTRRRRLEPLSKKVLRCAMNKWFIRYPSTTKWFGVQSSDAVERKRIYGVSSIKAWFQQADTNHVLQAGGILNRSKHGSKGTHWTAWFLRLTPDHQAGELYYFDSMRNSKSRVPSNIRTFAERLQTLVPRLVLNRNQVKHQRGSSECGMYVLYFIWHCLRHHDPHRFDTERVSDTQMKKLRRGIGLG